MRIESRIGRKLLIVTGTLLCACRGDRSTMADAPTQLAFLDAVPASVVSLQSLGSISVAFLTADGRIAANQSGTISLILITSDTTAHVTGVVDAAANGGVATFTNLKVNRAGTGYTFLARAEGLADVASTPFSITAGNPTNLRFVIRPNSAVAGDTMTVSVGFADVAGNPVADTNAVITLAALSASQDSVFGGATVASINGVAIFHGVSIHKAADQSIIAAAPGFGTVQSAPILVVSGPLAEWRFETQPTSGIAGVTLPSTAVRCTDRFGNPPSFPGSYLSTQVTLTFGENPVGAILTGTVTRFGLGFVDFNDLKIDKPGAAYSLALTPMSGFCGTLPGATSGLFNISP